MGIPIPKTIVIWAFPSHSTLVVRVRVTGDAHITRVLGMGILKTQGYPYHCGIPPPSFQLPNFARAFPYSNPPIWRLGCPIPLHLLENWKPDVHNNVDIF